MLYLYKQKMKFNSERNIVVNCMKCHKSISYRVILMIVIEDIYWNTFKLSNNDNMYWHKKSIMLGFYYKNRKTNDLFNQFK